MKRQRKLITTSIATLIATALLLTSNNSYSVAFAEENTQEKASTESAEVISNTEAEVIPNTENENSNTEQTTIEEESTIDEESKTSTDEDTKNDTSAESDVTEEISGTDTIQEDITSEENIDETENQELSESEEVILKGIQFNNGTLIDYNNLNPPTITLDIPEAYSVKIQFVNTNDTSKTLRYTTVGTTAATIDYSSVSSDGIYEISKIELLNSYTNYNIAYINPKYENVVTSEMDNIRYKDFSNGYKLEVKNCRPFEFSFEDFTAPNLPVSNGYDFTPTITIKCNENILFSYVCYSSDNDTVNIKSTDISSNGDLYTIKFSPDLPTGGYNPLKYLSSGNYSLDYLTLVYNDELSNGSIIPDVFYIEDINYEHSFSFMRHAVYDFTEYGIKCENPNEDLIPPTITDVYIEKSNVSAGDSVEVRINVTDNISGIKPHEVMYLPWYNEDGDLIPLYLEYDESSKCFKGEVNIPDNVKPGVYSIKNISFCDVALNLAEYTTENASDILSKLTLTVGDDDNNSKNDDDNSSENNNDNSGSENKPTNNTKPQNNLITTKPLSNTQTNSNQSITANKLPKTGDPISSSLLGLLSAICIASGFILKLKKSSN